MPASRASRLSAVRIAVGYVGIASFWVAFSDMLVRRLHLPPALLTIKGVAFVCVTGLLLHLTITRLVNTVRLTSRERDETARLYRTVVEASGEGICLLDECGQISFLNGRLAAMLGLEQEELQGRPLEEFVTEPELLKDLQSGLPAVHSEPREVRLRSRAEKDVWVLISFTPVFNAAGRPSGSLATFLDVTGRRRLEEDLRHSQKLQALGSFAGGITHDFNNLLSIMTGYGFLLEQSLPPNSPERNASQEIISACQRGTALISQLLAFSRKQTTIPELVDVGEVVTHFGEVLPRILGEDIAVKLQCEPTGSVRVGAGQIEQILMNLASNARDAMPRGGTLTIATRTIQIGSSVAWSHGVKPGKYVSMQVSDTGTGIDPELKPRIFEPFFTTKPQGKGTGLGLSTLYGIAAQNGGFITCDSTVGVGTTFTVSLPFLSLTKQQELPAEAPRALAGTETVLLVEDEPALRTLTRHILTAHGYTVLEAANGPQAIQIMESCPENFDLLLTDVVMPGMNGIELAAEAGSRFPAMQVAFMSGYAEIPPCGKAHVIHKPISPDALLFRLRAILDPASSGGHHAA